MPFSLTTNPRFRAVLARLQVAKFKASPPPIGEILALLGGALIFVMASYALTDGRWSLILCAAAGVMVLLAFFLVAQSLAYDFLTPLFFIGYQMLPATFFLLTLLTMPEGAMFMHPLPYLVEQPQACFFALIAPSVGFLIFLAVLRIVRGHPGRGRSLRERMNALAPSFEWMLIAGALLQFSLWFTGDEKLADSLVAYGLRIISRSVALLPFVAGYAAFRYLRATIVWIAVFALGVVFSFFTGSRGYAYLPMLPYLMGLFIGLPTWKDRFRIVMILSPVLVLVFLVASLVGERRTETGRFALSQVTEVGIGKIIDVSAAFAKEDSSKGDNELGLTQSGFARMVNWPNLAVPVMTPDQVGYRGFWDIGDEFTSFWQLGRFSGHVYWANAYANLYGFLVDEVTSVEFGIVADGASRAGMAGAIMYGLIAALILAGLEKVAFLVHNDYPGVFLVCVFGLCGVGAFDMVRTGMFSSVRTGLIGLIVLSVSFRFLALFLKPAELRRRRPAPFRGMAVSRPWSR